jgi:3-oxoacyl-[acyl-carrier protein] reductase
MDPRRLQSRVALVTGASRGIGRAVALRLAGEGAAVAVNYNSHPAEAEEVVDEIRSGGGKAAALQADVADKAAVDRMVKDTAEQLGPIDILVNNAGRLYTGDLLEYDDTELVIAVVQTITYAFEGEEASFAMPLSRRCAAGVWASA